MEVMEDKLIKLNHFFLVDKKIKEEMNKLCPPDDSGYLDNESLIKYIDNAFDSFEYIFSELRCVASDFLGYIEVIRKINLIQESVLKYFAANATNIDKLRMGYRLFVSDMGKEFLDSVKDECVGYFTLGIGHSLNYANTINELLHLLHSFILNNEEILQSIPVISEKENDYGYPISLRGVSVPYFNQLFISFPKEVDCAWTDMVAVNDKKLLMMVRDRGHALSIEITLKDDIARVEYFIPKLCNIDMINRLPGINKVNKDSVGATGVFEAEKNQLSTLLFDFISKVPTDSDMVFTDYEENNVIVK